MRIGFDAKRAFLNFRGLGNYSRLLISNFAKFYPENEVFLFTPREEINKPEISLWKKSFDNKIITSKSSSNIYGSIWRSFLLANQLKGNEITIYHGLSHELPYGIKKTKIRSIVTIHDLLFIRFPHFFPYVDRIAYKAKYTYSIKNADLIIAICEQTKTDLVHYFGVSPEKIEVVYQSCHSQFSEQLSDEMLEEIKIKYSLFSPYLLYVGALEQNKNIVNLIKAYAKASVKSDLALQIFGNGKDSYIKELHELITNLGLQKKIYIQKIERFSDLAAIYKMANTFIFPSFFEGFGIPIIEALHSRVPVITTRGGCFIESAGPSSYFIDPHSVDSIVHGIECVVSDSSLRKRMVEDGIVFTKNFSPETTSEKLNSVYKKVHQ